jgi:hypothetical protein
VYSRLTDGGEVVSLTRRPPLYPTDKFIYLFLLLISVRDIVDLGAVLEPEGLGQLEIQ